ncbi:ABC transporter permease [Actinoplanes sp. SE50]|uniref:ABC transporter permease n=1 Tax=unclassified Actinoplanes TaxID=2626549 RepID=UPI00023ECB15|nr:MULTISPECIES: ABC transporter permease [unclassified Actinoplanes]AEV84277.1 putative ABC transport system permease protein [Actinoplanes sp. SE50/110]ATO82669.1 ABC transporter permease [Actinoplanes sp. SE50]SLM00076.1 ABC transporter permease [Actinoplanes sp. SE50/110]
MNQATISARPALAVVLTALLLIATTAAAVGRLGVSRAVVTASLRAVAQLALVSVLITAVLRAWWSTAVFLLLMVLVAAATSARRISTLRRGWPAIVPIVAGAGLAGIVVVAAGTVPPTEIAVLPIAGILIGGAMTATSLSGRRARDELRDRRGEYEAALALGFLPRDAALEVCRPTAGQALVPALDQTRTVGLVTLPGAFVGVLLGGGSAVQAGATQLLVLVGLLAAEAVAAALTVELVANNLV